MEGFLLLQVSNLINKPVFCVETESAVGRILDVVIDPENGKLAALKVLSSIFSRYKILSPRDIIGVKPEFLVIAKESAIVKPEEIIHVKKIIDNKIPIVNNWVKTKDGEWLGRVEDLIIESATLAIIKIYIKGTALGFRTQPFLGTFKENRILGSEDIISIKKNAITVKCEPEVKEKVVEPELA